MNEKYLLRDWLDRLYIAQERARDMALEMSHTQTPPEDGEYAHLTGEDLRALAREKLEQLYGTWPPKTQEPLPLPGCRHNNPVDKRVYNAVWAHNRRQKT